MRENDIVELIPEGIKTEDGTTHEFDVVVFATGFDSITGGITQIDIEGTTGQSVGEKWRDGVYTQLGMTTSGFPNLFFTYASSSHATCA
jgi:cation diffusion facilitator CzcD-associated flavoprotein CzcO